MSKESNKEGNQLSRIFTVIKEYYLLFPLIIYLSGFLYVQGNFSLYVFEAFSISASQTSPVSQEKYILNGIFCLVILVISFLFAYSFKWAYKSVDIENIFRKIKKTKIDNPTENETIEHKRFTKGIEISFYLGKSNSIKVSKIKDTQIVDSHKNKKNQLKKEKIHFGSSYSSIVMFMILAMPYSFLINTLLFILSYKVFNATIQIDISYIIYFSIYMLFSINAYYKLINEKQRTDLYSSITNHYSKEMYSLEDKDVVRDVFSRFKDNNFHTINFIDSRKIKYNITQILFICIFGTTIAISLYLYGLNSQILNIMTYNNGDGVTKVSRITTADGIVNEYLALDFSKDFFIGYNGGNAITIPTSKIQSIETWSEKKKIKIKKYDSNLDLDLIDKEVAQTVENFYSYRLSRNATGFVGLLSLNYYENNYQLISPDILKKSWEVDPTFRNKNVVDFIASELSIPIKNKDNLFSVYVIEYWRKENRKYRFDFVKEKNTWKINSISQDNDFVFTSLD
ncbi:hypothetical protein [Paenibacillus rigui]|uniref:Uncharacterized protein n=1 Tax=Paenibacillus rigui TaxID=554312 RepID=A0A229URD4_9BACL|nr:hypothetical protein [Paenibacillus rigui]OXM85811.1 hypothetical protein CF651_11275 [Paenibacillus rigui]